MARPRQVLPGSFYLLTRRCTQRQFLLRPDDDTTNAFAYCLAVAASRCQVDVLTAVAESNHHHTVVFDPHGRISEFAEHFHKLVARCMNAKRKRWENFWAAEEPCITRLVDRAAVIEKFVYAASNPVKDQLVEQVHHWPGFNGYVHLRAGRPIRATRPRHFFRSDGDMPAEVTLEQRLPEELGRAQDVLDEIAAGIAAVVAAAKAERAKSGSKVVGRQGVLDQSWRAAPTTKEPRRKLRPRFAGRGEAGAAALHAFREFLAAYRSARSRWLAGKAVEFPAGTYWLARFSAAPTSAKPRPSATQALSLRR